MAGSSTGFTCENGRTARVTAADVVWVGIDAGKASHHAAAVDACGSVPVPRDSGRVTGNYHRPKRFHRPLRNVFYMMALSSLRAEGPSKVFYQRKRGENKRHVQALLALARRMVDVLWALLRDNRVYSPVPPSQVIATAA
jgi:hypothetical protein